MDTLFINDMMQTPGGNPWYFYFLFIAVKLPLPVLIAFVAGLVEVFRKRGEYPESRGYLFLRMMLVFWLLPEAFVGCKFLRYSLTLMPIIYMTAAVGVVALWRLTRHFIHKLSINGLVVRPLTASLIAAALIIAPSVEAIRLVALSYPSLYVNAFGRNRVGYFFPHDEFY